MKKDDYLKIRSYLKVFGWRDDSATPSDTELDLIIEILKEMCSCAASDFYLIALFFIYYQMGLGNIKGNATSKSVRDFSISYNIGVPKILFMKGEFERKLMICQIQCGKSPIFNTLDKERHCGC